MAIGDWELDDRGSQPSVLHSAEASYTPVEYPRSDENRGQVSKSNKGAASRVDSIMDSVAQNPTGNVNAPRRMGEVNYAAGPYPAVDDNAEGIDEIGGSI